MSDELNKKNNDDDVFKRPLPPNAKGQHSGGKDLLKSQQSSATEEQSPKKNPKAKNTSTSSLPDGKPGHSKMISETDPVNEEQEVERRKLQ